MPSTPTILPKPVYDQICEYAEKNNYSSPSAAITGILEQWRDLIETDIAQRERQALERELAGLPTVPFDGTPVKHYGLKPKQVSLPPKTYELLQRAAKARGKFGTVVLIQYLQELSLISKNPQPTHLDKVHRRASLSTKVPGSLYAELKARAERRNETISLTASEVLRAGLTYLHEQENQAPSAERQAPSAGYEY